jgi:nucleotide-binding universal stress UspA family protein
MTGQVQTSVAGIVIAVSFAVAMGALMLWMFRVPRPVTAEVARARRSLVPTTGASHSQRGVELACRLAEEQRAELLLLYVIEVPRTLQLDMPLAQAEREAQQALETGREVAAMHDLPVRSLIWRAREAATGIVEAAKDHDADLIVLGIGPKEGAGRGWGRTAEALLNRSPIEVVFDKLPE